MSGITRSWKSPGPGYVDTRDHDLCSGSIDAVISGRVEGDELVATKVQIID